MGACVRGTPVHSMYVTNTILTPSARVSISGCPPRSRARAIVFDSTGSSPGMQQRSMGIYYVLHHHHMPQIWGVMFINTTFARQHHDLNFRTI